MTKQLQKNIQQYREAVYKNSPVTEAYFALIHFVRKLRADLMKNTADYSVGNVSEGKAKYWDRLKSTSWNADKTVEPQYAVLESIICGEPDFSDLDVLSTEIIDKAMIEAREIIKCL